MLVPVMLVATLIVAGLLVTVIVRMGKRFQSLQDEVERQKVLQRDMATDVRTRLEDGARTWESVESEVRPRLQELESLEPSVADLSAALEENLPALTEARKRLEAVEARTEGAESRVTAALAVGAQEHNERFERVETAVRTLRDAADERLADLSARVTAIEDAVTVPPGSEMSAENAAQLAAAAEGEEPPPLPGSARTRARDAEASSPSAWIWLLLAAAVTVVLIATVL